MTVIDTEWFNALDDSERTIVQTAVRLHDRTNIVEGCYHNICATSPRMP